MPEFLRWAASKGFTIPPELKLPDRTETALTGPATSRRIEGYKELMPFCEAHGLEFGSERAALRRSRELTQVCSPEMDHLRPERRAARAAVGAGRAAPQGVWGL
jgi:hypothetical protein